MKGFSISLGLHSSPSFDFLPLLRRIVTLNSQIFYSSSFSSTAYGAHLVALAIRAGSIPVKSPLFNTPIQLTGWNRSTREFGRLSFFFSKAAGSDSDSKLLSEIPNLEHGPMVIALPLRNKPLIPGFYMQINVKDPNLLAALKENIKQEAPCAIGAFLVKDYPSTDSSSSSEKVNIPKKASTGSSSSSETVNILKKPTRKEKRWLLNGGMHEVGTLAQISSIQGKEVVLVGQRRLRITELVSEDPIIINVDHLKDKPYDKDDGVIKETYFQVASTLRDILKTNSPWREQVQTYIQPIGDFNYQHLADFGAGISANKHQIQGVLEELDVHKRLVLTLELLKEQAELNKWKKQELVPVQELVPMQELGAETYDESKLREKIRKRVNLIKDKIPKRVLKVIEEELTKLSSTWSFDFDVTYTYLDWLTELPWGNFSDENFDVLRAKKILDEDHYGLSDVKERILEFISVGRLRGISQGKIICLSGPPGVGKTSIGHSIARALNRKFFRFSVGGLSDVAEIKGHRRTYIGAMPGKLVQCLKSVGTANPLILIDEIDKLGRCYRGDPASALLEVMDPEQNANFLDHYLNVTIDLSKVLFVCTANEIDRIPGPLQDRMEVIDLAGYITDEKMHIARDYLVKTTCRDCGIDPEQVVVSDAALLSLIENYCREPGVRNLKKQIEKIYRKVALKLVREEASKVVAKIDLEFNRMKLPDIMKILESATVDSTKTKPKHVIDESNLPDYAGKPVFRAEKIYEETPVGVVMGLAWTSMGGSTLYIETTIVEEGEGQGGLHITGQLGDVMKESAEIAYTMAKKIMHEKEAKNPFFANSKLHLHVPAGATPKDGPSAGCTMITSLLSLAMKKPVRKDVAMTGELTLTGRILIIGGVKEKTLAARRSQVKTIIFPEANRRDFDELAENMKEGLDVHFVDEYEQIFELAFGYDHNKKVEKSLSVGTFSTIMSLMRNSADLLRSQKFCNSFYKLGNFFLSRK